MTTVRELIDECGWTEACDGAVSTPVKPRQRAHFLMVRHRAHVRRVFLFMAGMLR